MWCDILEMYKKNKDWEGAVWTHKIMSPMLRGTERELNTHPTIINFGHVRALAFHVTLQKTTAGFHVLSSAENTTPTNFPERHHYFDLIPKIPPPTFAGFFLRRHSRLSEHLSLAQRPAAFIHVDIVNIPLWVGTLTGWHVSSHRHPQKSPQCPKVFEDLKINIQRALSVPPSLFKFNLHSTFSLLGFLLTQLALLEDSARAISG